MRIRLIIMVDRLEKQVEEIRAMDRKKHLLELDFLQAQINPHFIYNILETFCMMAELGDNERLGEGIAAMGELMRYNLSGKHEFNLQAELHNVEVYTSLQNFVNNDRIVLSVDSDPSLNAMAIPKLLLQPLVENAILHGMVPRRELHIDLSVRRSEVGVCIRVKKRWKAH